MLDFRPMSGPPLSENKLHTEGIWAESAENFLDLKKYELEDGENHIMMKSTVLII
jgi:hypothetical protein